MTEQSADKKLCIGQFLGAHGVRGQVKLASFTEDPAAIKSYGPLADESGKRVWQVKFKSWNKSHFITEIQGIADRDAAERLRGIKLYVARDKLPAAEDGTFYYADLIGLEARLPSGEVFGKVVSVQNYGAGDILEITRPGGTELFPFSNAVVPEVKLAEGFLTIVPPEFSEGEEA